jgi:hypothetical protein
MTLSGIKSMTFQLVAQCFNQLHYSMPSYSHVACVNCITVDCLISKKLFCITGKHKETESWSRRSSNKSEISSKEELKRRGEKKVTPPGSEGKDKERSTPGRRTKSRSRSPVQHHRRTPSATAVVTGSIQVNENAYLSHLLTFSMKKNVPISEIYAININL